MKVWTTNDFTGHWPVGTSAVVIAQSEDRARELIERAVEKCGLKFDGTLREVPSDEEAAIILRDGNY